MSQLIAIRFLEFKGFERKFRAFQWMGKKWAKPWVDQGLVFSKHLGVGAGNGFSIFPDFSSYAFLGVFESKEDANRFFEHNSEWKEFEGLSASCKGIDGLAIKGHGFWNGRQPFDIQADHPADGMVAVITRASIDWKKAPLFWFNVPRSSRHIQDNPDLVLAKGVGEMPLVEQATLSIWKNQKALEQFAYRSKDHQPMIKKTRAYAWYKEEMFIRMAVVTSYGL